VTRADADDFNRLFVMPGTSPAMMARMGSHHDRCY
jgi:hypothetical protein